MTISAPVTPHLKTTSFSNGAPSPAVSTPDSQAVTEQLPRLTIIVPTRNEAGNIPTLLTKLDKALADESYEILFVDDSDDGTPAVVRATQDCCQGTVKVIHRKPDERFDGLGGAVVMGIRQAQASRVCVMDADLQHPPELVPVLLDQAIAGNADLVIASRHQDGGSARGLNFLRFGISQALDTVARLAFPKQLQYVSDPLTGFFLIHKNKIDVDALRPQGFKILLEILVRTPTLRIAEVPFQFGVRHAGESKADFSEGVRYVQHVLQLLIGEDILRFIRFCLIGLSGIFVNLFLTFLFAEGLGIHYLGAAVIATQGSSLWNFIWTETWVFRGRQPRWNRLYRMVMFLLMNNAALTLRGPIIFTLTSSMGLHYLLSTLISIIASTLGRYVLADSFIWRRDSHIEAYRPVVRRIA